MLNKNNFQQEIGEKVNQKLYFCCCDLEHKCGSDFNLSYIAAIMSRRKYFYNLWIRADGVCSLFLKLYTIGDTKGRRSGIVSAKYREASTTQNDGKMCKQCPELTETYRDEEIHPSYHVCYNKNNSKISQRLVYTRIFKNTIPKLIRYGY